MAETGDRLNVLNTMAHHRLQVQRQLQKIVHELDKRALVHDESKFREDEFDGFAEINMTARKYKYGSDEYKASITDNNAVELHYQRNSHHPEFFNEYSKGMGVMDLIEMVCDWYGAWKVYNIQKEEKDRITWGDNIDLQYKRFKEKLSKEQWFVVENIALFLMDE